MSSVNTGLSFTARLAHWSAVHRWLVLLATIIVIVLALASIIVVGTEIRDDGSGVGESGEGSELLNERFNAGPATTEPVSHTRRERVIFSNPSLDANDPAFKDTVESTIQAIRDLPQVTAAVSYYDERDASMFADDGHAVLAIVLLQNPDDPAGRIEVGPFLETVKQASGDSAGGGRE